MRNLFLILIGFLLKPVPWLLPGELTIPLILWVAIAVIALAVFLWLLKRAIRIARSRP